MTDSSISFVLSRDGPNVRLYYSAEAE